MTIAAPTTTGRVPWPAGGTRRVLFLDRDGVVNANHGYVHRAEDTEWVPGIFDLGRRALALGFELIVVTNQAGIARGLYTEEVFRRYTRWVHEQFEREQAPLLATYHCPHHPEAGKGAYLMACQCRKPAPGMLLRAGADWDVDLPASLLVGDQPSDVQAAQAAGVGHWVRIASLDLTSAIARLESLAPATPAPR